MQLPLDVTRPWVDATAEVLLLEVELSDELPVAPGQGADVVIDRDCSLETLLQDEGTTLSTSCGGA